VKLHLRLVGPSDKTPAPATTGAGVWKVAVSAGREKHMADAIAATAATTTTAVIAVIAVIAAIYAGLAGQQFQQQLSILKATHYKGKHDANSAQAA